MLGVLCQNAFGSNALYATWFAAAAACRMCKFVAVEVSVDSSRFNVVSRVAALASEGYTVAAESGSLQNATIVGPWSTLSKVLRAISIRVVVPTYSCRYRCSRGVLFRFLPGASVCPGWSLDM